jgi:alkyl hydroperoxide reductase subunit AhpC
LEKDFFAKHNTKLMGLSIDSIHSHIAWVNAEDAKQVVHKYGITKVTTLCGGIKAWSTEMQFS